MDLSPPLAPPASTQPLYRQLAAGYRAAIEDGTLRPGDRMPSVRALMQRHAVSLSTALQLCRHLEDEGWLEARPRSGYFVRRRLRAIPPVAEPDAAGRPDPAAFVGIHATVSAIVAEGLRCPDALNLGGASAAPEHYPTEALKNAALRALRRNPELLTTPGSPNGNPAFRAVLARRALEAGIRVTADEVTVTHGGIEAVNLALRAVANPGDTVAVESPTFFGLLQVLESLGMRALEIPTSPSSGISVEALELAINSYGDIKAVVVVPNLQNPLGAIMPDSRKAALVALCERNGIALIEDDPYREMHSRATPPKALKAWDRSGNVIHCASLNKVLAPGMRLGWMAAGRWQARVAMLKFAQSRHNEEWSQLAAAEFMATSAYDRHLQRLRELLREQREHVADSVAASFPPGTRLSRPDGGAMLWIELPGELSSRCLFEHALAAGIRIAPGTMFSNSNRFEHFIRLGCGLPRTPALDDALRRLGALAGALLATAGQAGAAASPSTSRHHQK